MGGHLSPWYGQMILVSGYSVWQLPTDHNIDVRCVCNISFPVLPNYNTRYKSLKQEPFALNFSKFLTFTLHTFVLTQMCHSPSPMLSRAYFWSTEMTANPNQHWGGRNHTSVSRFLTSIVARKCEIEHWYACGADGTVVRSVYGHVSAKFSGMGRFTYPWCSAGERFAREASTIKFLQSTIYLCQKVFKR